MTRSIVVVIECLSLMLIANQSATAKRLLIDDFGVPQQGFVTDNFAAFDLLEDIRLLGGGREVWGGASIAGTTFGAKIESGSLIANTASNDKGALAVTWPKLDSESVIDLSDYKTITLAIDETDDDLRTTITFRSNASGSSQIFESIGSAGRHVFEIPPALDLTSFNRLTVAFGLDQYAKVSLNAVWLSVPEPTSGLIVFLCLLGSTRMRMVRHE